MGVVVVDIEDLKKLLETTVKNIINTELNNHFEMLKGILTVKEEPTYTLSQFAKLVHKSPKTVWYWMKTGKFNSPTFKQCKLITHAEYLEDLRHKPIYQNKPKRNSKNKPAYYYENLY